MLRKILILGGGAGLIVAASALSGSSSAPAQGVLLLNPNHQCSYCHAAHDGQGGDLLIDSDVEVLCLTCHGPGGTSMFKAQNHVGQTCMVCHDPHDGQFNRFGARNIKMMRSEVIPGGSNNPRTLVLESRGSHVGEPTLHSFCDDDEDGDLIWDNACDTCHHGGDPDRHQYDRPDNHGHRTGDTCTRCHAHVDGFHK